MKKYLAILLSLFLVLASFGGGVLVSSAQESKEIPEVDGVYNDPLHPGIKVRVIVHKEKPTTTTAPVLVCGLSDPDSSSVVPAAGWHLPAGTWKYNLNTSSVPSSVGSGNLDTIATNGFSQWAAAEGNKVTFSRGSDTTVSRSAYDLQNVITWGRTQGTALAVTFIRYDSTTGVVVDVDTIMNKKFAWSWTNQATNPTCADSDTYDAQDILTHEEGHWTGLDDTYTADFVNNTMYGFGAKGEVKKDTLTTGDKAGVAAVYP